MEDNLRMGSNSKKSGAKKKKSSGRSSKSGPPSQPELEEAAPPRVESTSPSKKRKSDEMQIRVEEKSGAGKSKASVDQAAAKGKKLSDNNKTSSSMEAWERQLRPRKVPKTFEDVSVGEADATSLIGRRLRVFWPLDDKWYSGLVKSFDGKKKRHHVVYDDGDEEWLELKKERVKILVAPGEMFGQKHKENECEDDINSPKQKESSSSSSGDGNKRKQQSIVDIGKKNDRRKKKAVQEKQESAQKNKLQEEDTPDGETVQENAATNKVVDSEQVGSVDDHNEKNEALQNKEEITVEQDICENENEVEGKNSKKEKSSRRTAPRSKRGANAKRTQAKPITEHHFEDVHVKQRRAGHSEAKSDTKLEEGSKASGNANLEDTTVREVESIPNDDDEEKQQQKAKETGMFCEKKADSSVAETDIVCDMDGKGSVKDVTKQDEKLDESASVAEQLEEQQKGEQVNEDEPSRRTADQSSQKHLDVTVGDEKATEKQGDVKDADQLSKKHIKKHRGKVKPRQ